MGGSVIQTGERCARRTLKPALYQHPPATAVALASAVPDNDLARNDTSGGERATT